AGALLFAMKSGPRAPRPSSNSGPWFEAKATDAPKTRRNEISGREQEPNQVSSQLPLLILPTPKAPPSMLQPQPSRPGPSLVRGSVAPPFPTEPIGSAI